VCVRLKSLFVLLIQVFSKFGGMFTHNAFIFGAGYSQKQRVKWQMINFVIGQAKLGIYIREKIEKRIDLAKRLCVYLNLLLYYK